MRRELTMSARTTSFRTARALGIAAATLFMMSCDKQITQTEDLLPLVASSTDATAGNWKMIVLTTPNQVAVPAPTAVSSAASSASSIRSPPSCSSAKRPPSMGSIPSPSIGLLRASISTTGFATRCYPRDRAPISGAEV